MSALVRRVVETGAAANTSGFDDDSCVAYRLHSTFFESDFDHQAALGELVALHIVPYAAILLACVIGAVGHRILRPSVVVLGFCVGSMSTLHLFYKYAEVLHNWNCDAVVAASFLLGGLIGLIGATVVTAVSVVLGCIAGGSFCILLFDICASCNDALWEDAPVLLGKSLVPFWLTFAVCSGVGGAACKRQDARVLAFVTSVIGGWGAAVGIRLAIGAQRGALPSWAGLLIALGVAGAGFATQLWMMRREERARRRPVVLKKADAAGAAEVLAL